MQPFWSMLFIVYRSWTQYHDCSLCQAKIINNFEIISNALEMLKKVKRTNMRKYIYWYSTQKLNLKNDKNSAQINACACVHVWMGKANTQKWKERTSVCVYRCEILAFLSKKKREKCTQIFTKLCIFDHWLFIFVHFSVFSSNNRKYPMSIAVDVHSNEHQRHLSVCLFVYLSCLKRTCCGLQPHWSFFECL